VGEAVYPAGLAVRDQAWLGASPDLPLPYYILRGKMAFLNHMREGVKGKGRSSFGSAGLSLPAAVVFQLEPPSRSGT
jgi:hypothetical protein